MHEFQVFTDGGAFAKPGGNFTAVSSYRIFRNKELVHSDVVIVEDRTNQMAEINAIAKATENMVKYLDAVEDAPNPIIGIYTDSMTCYMGLMKWIHTWIKTAKNGVFYSSSKKPVLNQEEFKQAYYNMKHLLCDKRHCGIHMYHINSHIAKKSVKELKKKFEEFNKSTVSEEDFLFIYLQNDKCDKMIKEGHAFYVKNKSIVNNNL